MNPLIASAIGPLGAEQFKRTTGRSLGDFDLARRLLGGRRWSELLREEKLSIRRNTGWQLGPGGDWLYETSADPTLTPAFKERFGPWLTADKDVSTALRTLYDTVASLNAEESATAKSWNDRHPSDSYSSLLPHIYSPLLSSGKPGAELALSAYDTAVKLAADIFGTDAPLAILRGHEKYQTAKRYLDRPELSKAATGLSEALKRMQETDFKPFVGKLSDVLDLSADPEFAKAYPDFKDINVAISDSGDLGTMGSFSPKDNKITITKRNIQKHGLTGALRTALHELAHARQNREGAAPGGNDLTYIIDSPPDRDLLQAYGESLTKMEDVQANGSWFSKQLYGGPEALRDRIDAYRTTLAFLDRERTKFDQIAARVDHAAGGNQEDQRYYLYRSLAGEVDARNVSLRNGLDRKTRSNTLLEDTEDIPRTDQFDARFGIDIQSGTLNKANTVLNEHPYILQQAAKGGDAGKAVRADQKGGSSVPPGYRGPRIVINPSTFRNEKDALCVAFNEAFRIVMEETGFDPVSEPTEEQRKFFSDTAYRDNELQLRRTIIARICTFDTSVKDPTDEQLQEAVEFLRSVLEAGYPQNAEEQRMVQRILDVLSKVPMGQRGGRRPEAPRGTGTPEETRGDIAGGSADRTEQDDKRILSARGAVLQDPRQDAEGPALAAKARYEEPEVKSGDMNVAEVQNRNDLTAGAAVLPDVKQDAEGPALAARDRYEEPEVKRGDMNRAEVQNADNFTADNAILQNPKYDAEGPDAVIRRKPDGEPVL